jgi:hypothetical protein
MGNSFPKLEALCLVLQPLVKVTAVSRKTLQPSLIINRMHTRNTGVTANRRRAKYKTTPRDERHLVALARKYPEATYWYIIRWAGLEITPRTYKKVLQRRYLGNWRNAQHILLTEEDAQIWREFAEKYSRLEELRHLMRGLFSDECTIRNSPDNPGQWVFRLASERFRPDLVDTESHGRSPISIMVWAMVWQHGGEEGASKLVFCKGDPDSPRGGVTSRSYCDVLDEGLSPLYSV